MATNTRWTIGALLAVAATGCLGDPELSNVATTTARDQFVQRAWPVLGNCVGCHGNQPAIAFLAPGTVEGAYATIFNYQPPVIDVGVPSASLLVTMGKHTGPALGTDATVQLLDWLAAERDERFGEAGGSIDPALRAGPVMPAYGAPITLDLGINGATLTIATEPSEGGLYVKRITLSAGTGIKVRHPLFVSRPAHPIVDEIDRFADVDVTLASGQTLELGPAWFLSFSASEYLSIHFETLEAP